MESEIKTRGFAIDVSRDKLTVAKAELVITQEKREVEVNEVREFKYDNEGIEELIKFLGEYKEGIMESTGPYFFYLH
ncbi:First ORF in transposon ISC1491 [Saccharolobus solfataricus P2]|nr:First ORF in transposon ISC1491 [Saccharolobus solfataricus P2]SAI85391.1 ORF1 in transposon ISC1491 [Saccharolobus solfataricus]